MNERPNSPVTYKMKELCELANLPRQAIHFYIQEGLVPRGEKTGRNTAVYTNDHLERLRLIRRLQHEKFLPLKAIRAVLDNQDESFSPAQRRFLSGLKEKLAPSLQSAASCDSLPIDNMAVRLGVVPEEIRRLCEIGLVGSSTDETGTLRISHQDSWIVEAWGELRAIGFSKELGFEVADLAMYENALSGLFKREADLLFQRLEHLPADQVARMISRAIPVIHSFLTRYHETMVRHLVSSV